MSEPYNPQDYGYIHLRDIVLTAGAMTDEDDWAGTVASSQNDAPADSTLISIPKRSESDYAPKVRIYAIADVSATGVIVARASAAFTITPFKVIEASERREPTSVRRRHVIDGVPQSDNVTLNREIEIDMRASDKMGVRISGVSGIGATATRMRLFYQIDK